MSFELIPAETEQVVTEVIGCGIEVHRRLGPGFLERIYQEALCLELHTRGLTFERECSVVVNYKGVAIPGQRIDLIVQRCVIVELKAAARFDPTHEAEVISYLRSTRIRVGLLMNFNAATFKAGLKRIVV